MMKQVKSVILRNILGVLFVAALVALDQFTKKLAVQHLKNKASYVLINGVLELQYAENRGAAFGIFQNRQIGLVLITGVILLAVLVLFETTPFRKRLIPMQLVYLLVIAGALGNMIDRVRQNYVVDFIYFRIINFPNFNVADMCVTGACILLIVLMLFVYKDDEPLTIFSKKKTGEQV
jgi:signal peptidase II